MLDEVWIRNPIFDPKINGVRTAEELAEGFARHLARSQQQPSHAASSSSSAAAADRTAVKVSKADLVAYCKDLSADELLELASSVIDLPQLPSGAAPALSAHGTRPRAASSSGDRDYLWLLSSVSTSALSACLARRDAMLRRVFDGLLDSNGNGILEPDEVDNWMAWEAQRSAQDAKAALKEPGAQYFATPTQRAAVWKTLTTRPVAAPAGAAAAQPAPPALVSPKLEPVKRSTFSTITSLNPWKASSVMNPSTPTAAAAPATPTAASPPTPTTQQTNAPVRFEDVRRLFARWSVRELRIHFQERLLEEEDRARRRSARALAKAAAASASASPESASSSSSSPSLSASPVPLLSPVPFPPAVLVPFLPSPMTSDVQAVLDRLSDCCRHLESLSRQSAQQSSANLEVNACKRQLNTEVASIESSLLTLDQSRLIVSHSVDQAQADHKMLLAQTVEAKAKVDSCQAKVKSVGTRYEACINDVSALQSDLEKAKLAAKLLADELVYMQNLDKNGPAQQKALLAQIAKQEREVIAAENAWSDTKKIRASFERELHAIEEKIAEQQAKKEAAAAASAAALAEEPIAVSEPSSINSSRSSADAGSMAGASSALASLTPPRSRSASVVSLTDGATGSSVPAASASASAAASASSSSASSAPSLVAGLASGLGSLLARPLDAVSSLLSPSDPYVLMRTRVQAKLRDVGRQEEMAMLQHDALRANLALIQAQQRNEALKIADPKVAAARLSAIKEESEVKRGLIASLNSVHGQLQKTLNSIDLERKNASEHYKAADRHLSALNTRVTSLLGMIAKGESKLEQLAASKDGLADQLRVKIGTQAIVHAQQQETILPALAKINLDFNHALHSFRHAHTSLESLLVLSLRRADYAAHRAKMAAMGIDLPEVEDTHSQHISMPDMVDERGEIAAGPQRARDKALPTEEWASSEAVQGLKKLMAPVHTNVLRSPFLMHRPAPFPCVAHVSVEMQVHATHGGSNGGGFVMLNQTASSPGAFSSSLLPPLPVPPETQSTQGVIDVSACSMLYESDVPLGDSRPVEAHLASATAAYAAAASSAPEDEPARPIVSSLRRFCIDISRDLLDVYALDRYGHREDAESDDDDDDQHAAAASDGAAHATTDAPALPPAPHSPEAIPAPPRESMSPAHASSSASLHSSASPPAAAAVSGFISSASLLLTFRPGFRNRFLFNVDTNDSPSTAAPSSSVLSLVGSVSGNAATAVPKSAESALSSLTSGLAAAAPQHQIKLTADARTIRRIYLTLMIYLEEKKKRAAEATAAAHKPAELPQQAQAARNKPTPSSPQSTRPKPPTVPIAAPTAAASSAASSSALSRTPVSRSQPLKPAPSPPLYQRDTSVYVEGESALVHDVHLRTLVKACPSRYSLNVWGLVYSTARHGISRTRFFDVVSQYPSAIIIIKELKNQTVFGGFASAPFSPNSKQGYYGQQRAAARLPG